MECIDFPELGMEAVWRIEVEEFPAFVLVDDKPMYSFDPGEWSPTAVITPQSPLGRELMGKRQGDRVSIGQGPTAAEFSVARVS